MKRKQYKIGGGAVGFAFAYGKRRTSETHRLSCGFHLRWWVGCCFRLTAIAIAMRACCLAVIEVVSFAWFGVSA